MLFCFCRWSKKTRLVALIILAPVSSKTDVTTSSYEGFKFCIQKMLHVALIILAPVSSKMDVTTSSYEGFKFCI